jgi:hypothetical protein
MKMLRNAMMHTTPAQAPALESAVGRSAGAKPPPPEPLVLGWQRICEGPRGRRTSDYLHDHSDRQTHAA